MLDIPPYKNYARGGGYTEMRPMQSSERMGTLFAYAQESMIESASAGVVASSVTTAGVDGWASLGAEDSAEVSSGAPVADPLTFLTAGKACFTLKSKRTGVRFTYKVSKLDDPAKSMYFVNVLTGPDNWENYRYAGFIDMKGARKVQQSRKSAIGPDAPSYKAIVYVFDKLVAGLPLNGVEVWHEGKCGRCGRKLTVPESIANGIGPECAEIMGVS